MRLFTSDNLEVQRYATAATRNLIYENVENKSALIDAGGLNPLVSVLSEPDEELRKTITGQGCRRSRLSVWNVWDPQKKTALLCGFRCPVEPVLQRQPEGEAGSGSASDADRESPGSSVQESSSDSV